MLLFRSLSKRGNQMAKDDDVALSLLPLNSANLTPLFFKKNKK